MPASRSAQLRSRLASMAARESYVVVLHARSVSRFTSRLALQKPSRDCISGSMADR